MKNLGQWLLASRIELNWLQIGRNRKRMSALLESGERYTSPRLVELDTRTARLGTRAKELERSYRMMT